MNVNDMDAAASAARDAHRSRTAEAAASTAAKHASELERLTTETWDLTGRALPLLAARSPGLVVVAVEITKGRFGREKVKSVERAAFPLAPFTYRSDGSDHQRRIFLLSTRMIWSGSHAIDVRETAKASPWLHHVHDQLANVVRDPDAYQA
jgi:hypothetical protein